MASPSEIPAPPSSSSYIQRNWLTARDVTTSSGRHKNESVMVVSYNILATIHIKPQGYPFCPGGYREVLERHPLLMVELRHHGDADIICLQEVETDYFHKTLLPELRLMGFDGVYQQKALGVKEGVATFYRSERFTLEKDRGAHFKDWIAESLNGEQLNSELKRAILQRAEYETPILLTTFKCKDTGRPLSVANVHLVWQTDVVPDLNTLQACLAIQKLLDISLPESAFVVCGDFNHKPDMPGYQVIRDGCLDDHSMQHLRQYPLQVDGDGNGKDACLVDVLPSWFHHDLSTLRSAYKIVKGEEPPYTAYTDNYAPVWMEAYTNAGKLDGHISQESVESASVPRHFPLDVMDPSLNLRLAPPSSVKTLDYLWYSFDRLQCTGVQDVVTRDLIAPFWGCPNQVFPSDHLLMKAAFRFI